MQAMVTIGRMEALDWNDLRYALAVGHAGSLAAAARMLDVNHTTVLRRLDALEAQLGARLFERSRTGYEPTEAGAALLAQARRMSELADDIERSVAGRDREMTGVLRLSTAYTLMRHVLPGPLAAFAEAYPGIQVEVVENVIVADLTRRVEETAGAWARRESDVAIRLAPQVAEHLVGRQLAMTQTCVYALRGSRLPQSVQPIDALLQQPWIAFERDAARGVYASWVEKNVPHERVRIRVDIFNAVVSMVRTGVALGVLPTFMAPHYPDLVAVSEPIESLQVPVWMLTHPDLRQTGRVRAFTQFVGERVAAALQPFAPAASSASAAP